METKPIRVLVVDDHAIVRSGLAGFLRAYDDLELAGEAAGGGEAVRLCEQTRPDVVLMDLVMPGMDGAAATRAIREHCPGVQVIALTSYKDTDLVQRALDAGAIGYLLKNASVDELADAIRSACAGRQILAPEVAQALAQAEKLERLARAILDAPPDAAILPALLLDNVPGMLPGCHVEARIFPDWTVLRYPSDVPATPEALWSWLAAATKAQVFLPGEPLPWRDGPTDEGVVMAPCLDADGQRPLAGLVVSRRRDPAAVADLLPVVRSLAAQIGSVLRSAEAHAHSEADEKVARELAMAGQIQSSFLPRDAPEVAGWQMSAALESARETSGDFYDFIPLSNGRWGIVIGDVADKGMGAALYMALTYSLVRTYAAEHDARPDLVLAAANRRILSDTRAGLFVTAFYGILEPVSGMLTYCNAGHNPPYVLNPGGDGTARPLTRTGMALGVLEDASWSLAQAQLAPGEALVLYTDGVTEALDAQDRLFGEDRMMAAARSGLGRTAREVVDSILAAVNDFVGDASLAVRDDIAIVVLVRQE